MSWISQGGSWIWLEDGKGDPSSPPTTNAANPPPAAASLRPAGTGTFTGAPQSRFTVSPDAATTAAGPWPKSDGKGGFVNAAGQPVDANGHIVDTSGQAVNLGNVGAFGTGFINPVDPARPFNGQPGDKVLTIPQPGDASFAGGPFIGGGAATTGGATIGGGAGGGGGGFSLNDIENNVQVQTGQDASLLRNAGTAAQASVAAGGVTAANAASGVYSDAQRAADAARALGVQGLTTAQAQGAAAQGTANAAAAPLQGLGATDAAAASSARAQAADLAARTGMTLDQASQTVNQLLGIDTTAQTTGALRGFQGSNGTAGALQSMQMGVSATDALGQFQGSAGTAADLRNAPTVAGATGSLGAFEGSAGNAGALNAEAFNAGQGQTATGRLGAFDPSFLAGLNTTAAGTGQLGQFTGTAGTAGALASMPTGVAATGALGNFSAGGNTDLTTLERFANGGDIGPSQAEALLRGQSDTNMANSIALARSGRGAGDNSAAMRQALFSNAATQQKTGNDLAALRAQEAATARGQNIGAAGTAASTAVAQSAQTLQAMTEKQTGELTSLKTKLDALVASGQMSQTQAAQQLDALKAKQQGELQSIAQKSSNVGTAQGQSIDALKAEQEGQLASETQKINLLVASGQMTQAQAAQRLDALKSQQQGQLQTFAQQSTNLQSAGQQLQTQSSQRLAALQDQQAGQLNSETNRLNALVAAGQMTIAQANQQLDAMKSAQQGELAAIAQKSTNVTNAAGTQVNIAQSQADLTKAFATIGLQYDVNSGQVYDAAGKIVQGGDKIAADLLGTGLGNQAAQGAVGANLTGTGTQAFTSLMNTSADMQKAAAAIGVGTAAQIATLDQSSLQLLGSLVSQGRALDVQKLLGEKGIALQVDAMNAQSSGASLAAIGTVVAGVALALSDIRAKKDIDAGSFQDYLKSLKPAFDMQQTADANAGADKWLADNGLSPVGQMPQPAPEKPGMSSATKMGLLQLGGQLGGQIGRAIGSDIRAKKDITPAGGTGTAEVLSKLATPGTGAAEIQRKGQDMSFDDWIASKRGSTDVRAAKGYEYSYKDPSAPGAAPGRQYGSMAQDLEKTSAADAVGTAPSGMKYVDPNRMAMAAVAGLSEQQRRLDAHEEVLKRLIGRNSP